MTEDRKAYIKEWKLKNKDRLREHSKKYYMKNKTKQTIGMKCPCSRPSVTKRDGMPICSFCLEIENKLGRFENL